MSDVFAIDEAPDSSDEQKNSSDEEEEEEASGLPDQH